MSRDPFEELFGPLADDTDNDMTGAGAANDAPTAPLPTSQPAAPVPGVRRGQGTPNVEPAPPTAPLPARQRLAQEQAERVQTPQRPAPQEREAKSSVRALPWIIVGAVAVIAIIVSIVVVNAVRGNDSDPEASPDTSTSEEAPAPTEPTPGDSGETQPETQPEVNPETKPANEAPDVEVGPTYEMQIGPWGVTSELSQRFGAASFAIPDGVNLQLSTDLLNSFPDACSDMRAGWGATKLDDGSYEVLKPAESCAAAPELYETVWGLVDAWVETIK